MYAIRSYYARVSPSPPLASWRLTRAGDAGPCAEVYPVARYQATARHGTVLNVLVEIDVGANRCGVSPGGAAVALAQAIAQEPGLRFGA